MPPRIISELAQIARKHPLTWQYLFNFVPTLSYLASNRPLFGAARCMVEELTLSGIAITTVEQLFEQASCYQELLKTAADLKTDQTHQVELARASAENEEAIGDKTYNLQLLGEHPQFDLSSVYARFALQEPILEVANAYFRMYTCLRYYNIWHTLATRSAPRESQLWHRDREDYQILKVFVYLSDVDEGAGPLTYAAGTHARGKLRREASYFVQGNVKRSDDSQMAEVVPPEHWIKCVGGKGTVVFADTRGYHKGGLARQRDRLMFVCMFTSRSSQSPKLLEFPEKMHLPANKEQALALAMRR